MLVKLAAIFFSMILVNNYDVYSSRTDQLVCNLQRLLTIIWL